MFPQLSFITVKFTLSDDNSQHSIFVCNMEIDTTFSIESQIERHWIGAGKYKVIDYQWSYDAFAFNSVTFPCQSSYNV